MEQRSNRILKNFDDVCNKQRGNLANGAFNVCTWRPRIEAKAMVNEIVEDVSVRSGLKRVKEGRGGTCWRWHTFKIRGELEST